MKFIMVFKNNSVVKAFKKLISWVDNNKLFAFTLMLNLASIISDILFIVTVANAKIKEVRNQPILDYTKKELAKNGGKKQSGNYIFLISFAFSFVSQCLITIVGIKNFRRDESKK